MPARMLPLRPRRRAGNVPIGAQKVLPRSLSLRVRLTFLIAGTILPLIVATGIIVYQNYDAARRDAADRVLQATRGTMAAVDRELQNLIAALQVLALSPALQNGDLAGVRPDAERFASRYSAGHTVVVTDRSGQQLFNSGIAEGTPLPPKTDQQSVRTVFESGQPFVSNVFVGSVAKRPIFTVNVPVVRNGQVIYGISFNPPIERFLDIIDDQRLPPDWVISIFDREAKHVARRPKLTIEGVSRAAPSLTSELARSNQGIAMTVALEGTSLLSAFTRSPESGWIVAMGLPRNTILAPALRTLAVTVSIGLFFLAIGLVFALRLGTNLARAEADRELLIHELNHRVKNTLSTVQSIVIRTLRGADSYDDARKAIEARLMALSRAHNVLSDRFWQGADLLETVTSVLEAHQLAEPGRITVRGPDIRLKPQSALALAMVVNELATNATKYGALSVPGGRVSLLWELSGDAVNGACRMEWKERGGPAAAPPQKPGFGSTLIERSVKDQLRGTIATEFAPQGLTCVMEIPLNENAQGSSPAA
jgi:two-component sensor histidine kinase